MQPYERYEQLPHHAHGNERRNHQKARCCERKRARTIVVHDVNSCRHEGTRGHSRAVDSTKKKMFTLSLLAIGSRSAGAVVAVPTTEIAPGVHMPQINLGTCT